MTARKAIDKDAGAMMWSCLDAGDREGLLEVTLEPGPEGQGPALEREGRRSFQAKSLKYVARPQGLDTERR